MRRTRRSLASDEEEAGGKGSSLTWMNRIKWASWGSLTEVLAVVVETSVGDFEVCVLLWERKSAEGDGNPYTSAFLPATTSPSEPRKGRTICPSRSLFCLDGAVMENDLVAAHQDRRGTCMGTLCPRTTWAAATQIQTQIFIGSYLIVLQTSPWN